MASPRASGLRRLDAVLQAAREPVFLLDAHSRVAFTNRAFEALTGRPGDVLLGLECRPGTASPEADLDGLAAGLAPPPEALAGRPCGGPTLIVHAEGDRSWRRVEFWPHLDAEGRLLGMIGMVRDRDGPAPAPESDVLRVRSELMEVRESLRSTRGLEPLIGQGARHQRLLGQVTASAATEAPVLIVGEPGTGRRTVARAIHYSGPRREAPLVPIDVAALPPEVLRREIRGDQGGRSTRPGLPDGASLLLGDVLELPRDLQETLEATLREGRFRLLALTSADPEAALRHERLRPDLYYLLTVMVLRLAPLRERLDELPLLAHHLLDRANASGARRLAGFEPETLDAFRAYDWPGNLRELGRVIEAARDRASGDLIAVEDLPASVRGHLASAHLPPPPPPPVTPLDEWLTRLERRLIEQALARARQNKSRAAELLEISRPRLYRRIKELGLPDVPEPAEEEAAGLG